MHINVTDNNNTEYKIVCDPELSINGRIITSVEEAVEEIDRILSVRNNGSSVWHFCPLYFRTNNVLTAFDARTVSSYEVIPDVHE